MGKRAMLTIHVYDVRIGAGIPSLGVYLFEGGGGIEPAENATHSGETDSAGDAVFEVLGMFRVCISDGGYEAADPHQAVPETWKDVYSAFGACGVSNDYIYPFPLICPQEVSAMLGKAGAVVASLGLVGMIVDSARRA